MRELTSNNAILEVCRALIPHDSLDTEELDLLAGVDSAPTGLVSELIHDVREGNDPLGDTFMRINTARERRPSGAVYTPLEIVDSMVAWAQEQINPARIVDCGCGSGRFALEAARTFPGAHVAAVDSSPMATLMCKANAIAAGLDVTVVRGDFTQVELPFQHATPTLWIGNPPYVRHHNLSKEQKERYLASLRRMGIKGSGLAGLHSHFVASIAERFGHNDCGCLVMSAEWMDVGYGVSIREIMTGRLALKLLQTFDKTEETFTGTMSSAVIVGFSKRSRDGLVRVNEKDVPLEDFVRSSRWNDVVSCRDSKAEDDGFVQLGDIARVHRGVVTGKNSFWVRKPGEVSEQLCVPVVSHARELSGEIPACRNVSGLSRLVTLPENLSDLSEDLYEEAKEIVQAGLREGVPDGFVASHRKSWWSIKAPEAPAIMMTYMARHAPTFVVNSDKLGMLNVVHGIYPTVELSDRAIANLAKYLNNNVNIQDGRVYSGGLAKFEPREVERLVVPSPEALED